MAQHGMPEIPLEDAAARMARAAQKALRGVSSLSNSGLLSTETRSMILNHPCLGWTFALSDRLRTDINCTADWGVKITAPPGFYGPSEFYPVSTSTRKQWALF